MKCLLVADLHYALKQFDWLRDVAGDYDVVFLAGDLLEIASSVERRAQIVVVETYLEELAAKTRVIVCSGNHDLDSRNGHGELVSRWIENLPRIGVTADWNSVMLGGTLVTVCPWWDGPATRDEIAGLLTRDAAREKSRWVWVYHAPPPDSPVSWSGTRHYGDTELAGWIAEHQPDLVLTGHVHRSPFVNGGSWADRIGRTWVFNSGQQIGDTPAHIALDLDGGEAAWFSLAGAEILSMRKPLERPFGEIREIPDWLRV